MRVLVRVRVLVCAVLWLLAGGCASEMKLEDVAAEYYNLGNGFYELKKYDLAIRYYEMALARSPDLKNAKWNLALAYVQSQDYASAERILVAWLERDPEALEAREVLAVVYRGQNRREEAVRVLDRILEIAPEDTVALNNIAIILWEMGRKEEAAAYFVKLLEYEPTDRDVLYNLAVLSEERQRYEEALGYAESYLALIETGEQDQKEYIITASYIAARGYVRGELYYRALETYERILALDEREPDAWFEQAEIFLTSVEDPDRGLEHLRKALEMGFSSKRRLAELLARSDLLVRGEVEALLKERGLLPSAEEREAVLHRMGDDDLSHSTTGDESSETPE